MTLSIGISCHPTLGGSGIVATGIGLAMAARGHTVTFIGTARPSHLPEGVENVRFQRVEALDYPVFASAPGSLALCSAIVDVARQHGLDVLHAHYAVPHAVSAWMAREVLGGALPLLTTLHGTDITLVGSHPSYLPITRHAILRSDRITAPSAFLRDETWARFDLDPETTPIEVIPNFVDPERHRPLQGPRTVLPGLFGAADVPTLVHVSNFRPLKRIDRVVDVFAEVARVRPVRLLLVGEGPERAAIEARVAATGLAPQVRFLGAVDAVEHAVRECAVFLLPSETESFGLAALEALAAGVPVVASRVGGLPEVVQHGETGFLVDDAEGIAGMVARVHQILDGAGPVLGRAARADVLARFTPAGPLDRFERLYAELARGAGTGTSG